MFVPTSVGEIEVTKENSVLVRCDRNDLWNGLYTDLDKRYMFVPAWRHGYGKLALQAQKDGVAIEVLTTLDAGNEMQRNIMHALGERTVEAAEHILRIEG